MPHHPKQSHPFLWHRFSVRHLGALRTLAINRLVMYMGTSLLALFLPIFLYEYFDFSLRAVLLWYLVLYLARIPFHVFAAKIFSRTGLVPSMVFGVFGALLFYASVFFLDAGIGEVSWLLVASILGICILVGFYWTPFHVDFATFTKKGKRGEQVALLYVAYQVIAVVSPALAGLLVMRYSYGVMFIFGFVMIAFSLIPIFYLPRTKVRYEFGFFETFQKMFARDYRNMTLSMFAAGAENVVGIVIWPLFLFIVFRGEHLDVGIFAAVVMVVGILLQLIIGKRVDRGPARSILKWGARVYSLGWFFKAFVTTVVGVFAASTFHALGSIFMRTPFDAIYYEKAADAGHYIDEFTVIREAALSIGRLLMVVTLLGVTHWLSLSASFVVAAIVSLGVTMLARATVKE